MTIYERLKEKMNEPSIEIRRKHPTPSLLRDFTGVFVCAMIVFASLAMGYVQAAVKVFAGVDIIFDASWSANLSAMASMALGALIQQKIGNSAAGAGIGITPSMGGSVIVPQAPYNPPVPDGENGVCSCCGQPLPANVPSDLTIK